MSDENTPSMENIRDCYARYGNETTRTAEFNRAIAAHDRALREQTAQKIEASEAELAILLDMFAENKTWASTGAEMARRIIATVAASARGEGSE